MKKKLAKTGKKQAALMVGLSLFALSGALPEKAAAQNIACPQSMIFGDIIACSAANAVVVHPDNTRTSTGCLVVIGTFSRGRCLVTQKGALRPVQVSIAGATFTITAGAATMKLDNFNIISNGNGPTYTDTKAALNVPIGADLNVGVNQAGGSYSGTFVINANRL